MSAGARHGKPEEELFFQQPSAAKTPTVEPLRINKRDSRSPELPTAPNSQRSGFAQPVPYPVSSGPSTSPAPNPQRGGFSQPVPYPSTSPPPNTQRSGVPQPAPYPTTSGASSSPAPLPYYPEERPRAQSKVTNGPGGQRAYSDRPGATEGGRASPAYSSSSSHSSSSDHERPSISGYTPALRPRDGRDGQPGQGPSRLAERRGNIPKPLPDSPGPDTPDKEGLFQRLPQRGGVSPPTESSDLRRPSQAEDNPYPNYYQQYWPPPGAATSNGPSSLPVPNTGSVNRLSSSASTSTTRAQRGSPPPPETPIIPPGDHLGGGIEARYAAAGIAGTSTLTSLQAQNAAAAQRANQYTPQPLRGQAPTLQQQQEPPRRPWTPTEQPGSQPHGPPTVYQGPGQASSPTPVQVPTPLGRQGTPATQPGRNPAPTALEQDLQRMHVTASPPPAYSSVSQGRPSASSAQAYPNEKRDQRAGSVETGAAVGAAAGVAAAAVMHQDPHNDGHPAFANDSRQQTGPSPQPGEANSMTSTQRIASPSPGPVGTGPASPPPLPEGWIAHLDPNSGQYYYIHLPTQSTQWEFPKGPTPLNLNEPLSPTSSVYGGNPLASPGLTAFGGKPMASPGFQPSNSGYPESVISMQSSAPTVGGFSGPPPSSGVDMYKVAPTNGVYFGPYLRYTNMDLERGLWLGSILLVTDAPQPPTIHIHQSMDLSPNPRQLKGNPISHHQRWTFYRYDIDLRMEEDTAAKWTYAITSHLGCTRYEFLVAGRYETNWRFIATSGNDFSLNVNANERSRLGGIGYMWKDIMQKHVECGGFHTQLGLGDQIYADRLWKEIPSLKQWLAMSGKENRKNAQWTAQHEEDVSHAYFHYYTSHFDQPYLREAFAQIPHVLQIDDHDM